MNYIILQGSDIPSLEAQVRGHIDKGWYVKGGASSFTLEHYEHATERWTTETWFMQTMVQP